MRPRDPSNRSGPHRRGASARRAGHGITDDGVHLRLQERQSGAATGPRSAIAITEDTAYALSVDHHQIDDLSGAGIATNNTYGYETIFASPALLSATSNGSVWNFLSSPAGWYRNGSSIGFMMASAGGDVGSGLFNLNTEMGSPQRLYSSPDVFADPPPAWTFTSTGGSIARLVGGGQTLYAVTPACPVPASKPSPRTAACP